MFPWGSWGGWGRILRSSGGGRFAGSTTGRVVGNCRLQVRFQLGGQVRRHAARFFVDTGAGVEGFAFEYRLSRLVYNPMPEVQPHRPDEDWPYFDRQQIIITGGELIADTGFDDGKDHAALLPGQHGIAEGADELAARGFEQVKISRMVDMVAEGALGVGDAV